jgi:hypothetical protein
MTQVTAGVPEQRRHDRSADDVGRHRRPGDAGPVGEPEEHDQRDERPLERADRNMVEMLQELRVAQTGVQILFAFLLSLSFTEAFGRIDAFQRWTYVVTLLLTALTTGLLVAPAAIHRMLFGRGVKAVAVRIGHQLFVAGLVALTLTLMGAVLLVLDVAVGRAFALWSAAGVGTALVLLWFVLPLPVRARNDRDTDGADTGGADPGGADPGGAGTERADTERAGSASRE